MNEKKRQQARIRLANSRSFSAIRRLSTLLDDYYLDAIAGFTLPGGIGDALCAVVSLFFAGFSLFRLRSVPLTLAVLNNTLRDVIIGLIPFYVGDVLDIFYRSNKKNLVLIEGFVEGQEDIIGEVNRKALWSAALFIVLCAVLFVMFRIALWAAKWIFSLF